jgi:hypothetical protein
MESEAPGGVEPGIPGIPVVEPRLSETPMPESACPVEEPELLELASQLPLVWFVPVDGDDPPLDEGHPKSLCDEDPPEVPPGPLIPPPRLKLLDPLFKLLDPPKLLEPPNPDDPPDPLPKPLPDPF